jgi:hypothetical protein
MIDISFEINGRKIRPNQVTNELERALIQQIEQHIRDKLRHVRDPGTGLRPKIRVKGHNLRNLQLEVSGPESILEETKRLLA